MDNGRCGELLFELRMGLICDRLGDTFKSFEILLDWVPSQFVDKALVVLMGLHSLLSFGFLASAPPQLEFPLKIFPPLREDRELPDESSSSWFLT